MDCTFVIFGVLLTLCKTVSGGSYCFYYDYGTIFCPRGCCPTDCCAKHTSAFNREEFFALIGCSLGIVIIAALVLIFCIHRRNKLGRGVGFRTSNATAVSNQGQVACFPMTPLGVNINQPGHGEPLLPYPYTLGIHPHGYFYPAPATKLPSYVESIEHNRDHAQSQPSDGSQKYQPIAPSESSTPFTRVFQTSVSEQNKSQVYQ